MGGGSSTVPDCKWWNFPRFRGQDPSVDVGQLETSCTSEWPTFGVGWPPEGTLNLRHHPGSTSSSYREARSPRPIYPHRPWAGISAGHAWLAPTVRHARVQGCGDQGQPAEGRADLLLREPQRKDLGSSPCSPGPPATHFFSGNPFCNNVS